MSQTSQGTQINNSGGDQSRNTGTAPATTTAEAGSTASQQEGVIHNRSTAQRGARSSTRNNFSNLSRIDTGDSNTNGENEVFGYVIGTRNEKLTHGKVYNEFKDLLVTFVGSDFKHGDDISCLIRDLKDPEDDLKIEHGATKPTKNADGK